MNFCRCFLAIYLLTCIGCEQLSTEYGETRGLVGRTSLNGFGALRTAYENAGYQSRDINRLSKRLNSTETIIWLPKVPSPNDDEVTKWMESWLAQGNRTMVYVLPDSGSEVAYWSDARALAPVDQQTEYRRREVRGINQQFRWRLNRQAWRVNGWFEVQPFEQRVDVSQITGPWTVESNSATDKKNSLSGVIDAGTQAKQNGIFREGECWVEYRINELGSTSSGNKSPSKMVRNSGFYRRELGPGSLTAGGVTFMPEYEDSPVRKKVTMESMIELSDGTPLVARLRSKNWKGSQVFVVAGGSLLTNYALSKEWNCWLADQIILATKQDASAEPTAGFLLSDWNNIPVTDSSPNRPSKTGMEMLTEWPLSLITLHGIFLGGIVCLIMLPILGRPKKKIRESPSDFTHHLDAVGMLMKRVKGKEFAKERVEEYFRVMQPPPPDTADRSKSSMDKADHAGPRKPPSSEEMPESLLLDATDLEPTGSEQLDEVENSGSLLKDDLDNHATDDKDTNR